MTRTLLASLAFATLSAAVSAAGVDSERTAPLQSRLETFVHGTLIDFHQQNAELLAALQRFWQRHDPGLIHRTDRAVRTLDAGITRSAFANVPVLDRLDEGLGVAAQ